MKRLVTLKEARSLFPGRPCPVTLWNWRVKGVRRPDGKIVKLKSIRIGARVYISVADATTFIRELSE